MHPALLPEVVLVEKAAVLHALVHIVVLLLSLDRATLPGPPALPHGGSSKAGAWPRRPCVARIPRTTQNRADASLEPIIPKVFGDTTLFS